MILYRPVRPLTRAWPSDGVVKIQQVNEYSYSRCDMLVTTFAEGHLHWSVACCNFFSGWLVTLYVPPIVWQRLCYWDLISQWISTGKMTLALLLVSGDSPSDRKLVLSGRIHLSRSAPFVLVECWRVAHSNAKKLLWYCQKSKKRWLNFKTSYLNFLIFLNRR